MTKQAMDYSGFENFSDFCFDVEHRRGKRENCFFSLI